LKIAIVDANYTQERYEGLAASWLHWELARAGLAESAPEDADFVLLTVSSQQGITEARRALRRIKNKRTRVILGGGGAYAPAVFEDMADAICVGEGARFVRVFLRDGYDAALALPETWVPGMTTPVTPGRDFPWDVPPIRHPDGTVRVFGARGCRYRCLFCQTGWEATYRPNPDPARLQRQIDHLEAERRRVAIVTNDGAEESVVFRGQQEFLSVRLRNLQRMMPITREQCKSVRIGVEGVSERLRVAVGKPVPNDDLLRVTFDLLGAGVGVRWFFVPGLPGEKADDYDELRYLVSGLKRLPKGCVMMNFHAFIPQPAAPLCIFPLTDEYWEPFDEFRRWFFHGPGFTRHVQIIAPSRYPGRLRRAMESMAASETELRRGWWEAENRNWRIQYLATPCDMRRMAAIYARKVGLAHKV